MTTKTAPWLAIIGSMAVFVLHLGGAAHADTGAEWAFRDLSQPILTDAAHTSTGEPIRVQTPEINLTIGEHTAIVNQQVGFLGLLDPIPQFPSVAHVIFNFLDWVARIGNAILASLNISNVASRTLEVLGIGLDKADVFMPGRRFREGVNYALDAVFARDLNAMRPEVEGFAKRLLEFGLPTHDAQLSRLPVFGGMRQVALQIAVGILVLAFMMHIFSILVQHIGNPQAGLSVLLHRSAGLFLLGTFALLGQEIAYLVNGVINGIAQSMCPNYACLDVSRVMDLLFPSRELDLIQNLVRALALIVFLIGMMFSFTNRWILANLVVWTAPIAIASAALRTGTGVTGAWINAYLRLMMNVVIGLAMFYIARHHPVLLQNSRDPLLMITISAAFSALFLIDASYNGFGAMQSLKAMTVAAVRSVAQTVASVAGGASRAVSNMPAMATYAASTALLGSARELRRHTPPAALSTPAPSPDAPFGYFSEKYAERVRREG